MATNEEKITALEARLAALEYAASPQAVYDRLKIAFPGEVATKATDADDRANPPKVPHSLAHQFAWVENVGYFVIWVAGGAGTKIAPIRKTVSAMQWGCDILPAGSWVYGKVVDLPGNYKVLEIIGNPMWPDCEC